MSPTRHYYSMNRKTAGRGRGSTRRAEQKTNTLINDLNYWISDLSLYFYIYLYIILTYHIKILAESNPHWTNRTVFLYFVPSAGHVHSRHLWFMSTPYFNFTLSVNFKQGSAINTISATSISKALIFFIF